ncbi:Mitochondrial import inner membrane translocase subunit TIM44 [Lamellibrachia satsuma]|nr:Mitochondrial import inner membrane translocase subunit TIM44 [Lamellibrachia satsuma]
MLMYSCLESGNDAILKGNMATMVGHVFSKTSRNILRHRGVHLECARCLGLCSNTTAFPTRSRQESQYTQNARSQVLQTRHMAQKAGFLKQLVDNIKNEMTKNKEMKDSLQKFREEADKLEQTEALQKAREKYQTIEAETTKGSDAAMKTFSVFQEKLKETLEEAEKTELAKKGKEFTDELSKTARQAARKISEQSEHLSQTTVYRTMSEGMKAVKTEIDETALSRAKLYRPPAKLRKRQQTPEENDERVVEANTEATGMVMHKDSRWYQSWQSFKDNNQIVTKLFDMKAKYDESDHLVVRATRAFTEKFTDVFGNVFSKTEMSEVLTEIVKSDPSFDKESFVKEVQFEIIPNILEAMVRGELEILKDWCYEAAYNLIAQPIKQVVGAGYKIDSRVLDINNVDIVAGKIMEQGPVLVLSFNAQQVIVVRDSKGAVVEGDPDKIMKIFHVWAFCRDQSILDPKAAWRIIDISSSPAEQWV